MGIGVLSPALTCAAFRGLLQTTPMNSVSFLARAQGSVDFDEGTKALDLAGPSTTRRHRLRAQV